MDDPSATAGDKSEKPPHANAASDRVPLLSVEGARKAYGGVVALDGVGVDFYEGEVHALMGENGAGKSTLGKLIAGAIPADQARFRRSGNPVKIANPVDAQRLGITIIFQELDLFPQLSVAENIAIRNLRFRETGVARYRKMDRFAARVLQRVGLGVSPRTRLGDLPIAHQQLVAIARALSMDARLIVFDESTSALTEDAVDRLFEVIGQLRAEGVASVMVTHKMDEVFRIADRVTVLRDGQRIGTRLAAETDMTELVRMMIGHDVDASKQTTRHASDEVVLRLRGLRNATLKSASLDVCRGEVVGVAGLVGAGRGEIGRVLFGLSGVDAGAIEIAGRPAHFASPRQAMRRGVALLPRDRKTEGLMMQMSVLENVTLAVLPKLHRLGWVHRPRAADMHAEVGRITRLKAAGPNVAVSSLSGGNQQKALLGRWLLTDAEVYFLDDPTRGVDVGAKEDVYRVIQQLAQRGKAVLMVSSELPELLRCCDRIVVMNNGRTVASRACSETTQNEILTLATTDNPRHPGGA